MFRSRFSEAAVAMSDGDHGVIRPDDGVRVQVAFNSAEETLAQLSSSAPSRSLVEENDPAATVVVRLMTILE